MLKNGSTNRPPACDVVDGAFQTDYTSLATYMDSPHDVETGIVSIASSD